MKLKKHNFQKNDFIDSFKQFISINVIHNIYLLNYRLIFLYRYTYRKDYRRICNHMLLKSFLAFLETEHAHSETKHAYQETKHAQNTPFKGKQNMRG